MTNTQIYRCPNCERPLDINRVECKCGYRPSDDERGVTQQMLAADGKRKGAK